MKELQKKLQDLLDEAEDKFGEQVFRDFLDESLAAIKLRIMALDDEGEEL